MQVWTQTGGHGGNPPGGAGGPGSPGGPGGPMGPRSPGGPWKISKECRQEMKARKLLNHGSARKESGELRNANKSSKNREKEMIQKRTKVHVAGYL